MRPKLLSAGVLAVPARMEFKSAAEPEGRKHMFVEVEVKDVSEKGLVSGYASIFGNIDLGGDVISKDEPFKEFVKDSDGKVLHLFQHDSFGRTASAGLPIGLADVEQNSKGLKFESQLIMEDPFVKERLLPHFKAKTLRGMSIGYDVLPGGSEVLKNGVRQLNALKLWEISSVTFGMNPKAATESVKAVQKCNSIRELEDVLRDATGLSRAQAKLHASAIWKTLSGQREAGGEDSAAAAKGISDFLQSIIVNPTGVSK